jgi:methenyltetrahydrofolate cyclohydrolase
VSCGILEEIPDLVSEDLAREALSRKAAAQAQIDGMEPLQRAPALPASRGDRRPGNLTTMRDVTMATFLGQLSARTPAPGGGAAAALHAAQAAALIAMVARYSDGPRQDAEVVGRVRAAADGLTDEALGLAEADTSAFGKVASAYRLPRQTPEQKAERSEAIAAALGRAARPPADLMAAAIRLAGLAEDLLPSANRNVISDLAAAAAAISAAATTARVNIEANLTGITDDGLRAELTDVAGLADGVTDRADRLITAVREEMAR